MIIFACVFMGLAIGGSVWLVLSVASAKRNAYDAAHRFEKRRRREIRERSFTFRYFEPAIDEIGERMQSRNASKLRALGENLAASGMGVPWKPWEFLATKMLESLMLSVVGFLFLAFFLKYNVVLSIFLAGGFGWAMYWVSTNSMKRKAQKRRQRIKRDFASAIDLLALMMEVGGGFLDSLKVVSKEFSGKSLGEELATVVNDIELGQPRKKSLESFANRMLDDDVAEVVFACNESEELGVPLSDTLRVQADRIRQKRSTWAEKAAQEAEVAMTFPAMIIMIACLITVGAPFVLSGLGAWTSSI
jgi:tight adherence protein C